MNDAHDHPGVESPESRDDTAEAPATTVDGKRPKRSRRHGKHGRSASASMTGGKAAAEASSRGDQVSADEARKARKVRGKRRQDLNQALVLELRTLRASLGRTLESIELRLGGRITELLHGIEGDPGLDQKPKPLTVKAAQAALAEIEDMRIKPKRGRLKDIRRTERTLKALREIQPKS